MRRYITGEDRNQLGLQPMCLDDLIPESCEVRALDAIVENMGIPTMGFIHAEPKETGRKPYDPVDLFKLYVYSYFNGIRSSRKIERECHRNMEVIPSSGGMPKCLLSTNLLLWLLACSLVITPSRTNRSLSE